MLQLGMDTGGSELRAKMQSTSLLSDMESFKAANPGAVLCDFVRWHSPRDWEDDTHTGKVSSQLHNQKIQEFPGRILRKFRGDRSKNVIMFSRL